MRYIPKSSMAVRIAFTVALANLLLAGATRSASEAARNSGVVCCLQDKGNELKVRLINALQTQAGKLVKKTCILVAMPPESCEEDGSTLCEQKCEEKMKSNPTYLGMMEQKSRASYTSMKDGAKWERASAWKRKEGQKAPAQQALQDVQDLQVLRNRTLVQRQDELQKAQKDFEDAEQAQKQADEKLEKLMDAAKDVEHSAAVEEEQKQAEIEARVEEAYTKIAKIQDEKRKMEAQMKEHGKQASAPMECADGKYCCCSIRHNPVRVKTSQFIDWGECTNPTAYPKSASKEKCPDVNTYCPTCAALLCEDNGYGLCP